MICNTHHMLLKW